MSRASLSVWLINYAVIFVLAVSPTGGYKSRVIRRDVICLWSDVIC